MKSLIYVHNYIYSGIKCHQKFVQKYKPCGSFGAHVMRYGNRRRSCTAAIKINCWSADYIGDVDPYKKHQRSANSWDFFLVLRAVH